MAKKFKKEIGDTTSLTIPKNFTHTKTMQVIEVDDSHLNFISKNLEDRKLVHAIFSAIHDYIHTDNQTLVSNDAKLDEILEHLKTLKLTASVDLESSDAQNKENEGFKSADINEILDVFGE